MKLYIMIFVCASTKSCLLVPLQSRKTEDVAMAFNTAQTRSCVPMAYISDREGSFREIDRNGDTVINTVQVFRLIRTRFIFAAVGKNTHTSTGNVERRCRMIRECISNLDLRKTNMSVAKRHQKYY